MQEDCHEFQANLGCTVRFHHIVFFTLKITNDNTHQISLGTSLPVNFLLSLSFSEDKGRFSCLFMSFVVLALVVILSGALFFKENNPVHP